MGRLSMTCPNREPSYTLPQHVHCGPTFRGYYKQWVDKKTGQKYGVYVPANLSVKMVNIVKVSAIG